MLMGYMRCVDGEPTHGKMHRKLPSHGAKTPETAATCPTSFALLVCARNMPFLTIPSTSFSVTVVFLSAAPACTRAQSEQAPFWRR
jgi:hypothetical protein